MLQGTYLETGSRSGDHKIFCLLKKPKFNYRVQKDPLQDASLNNINSVRALSH
jgi:hypothetical protein